MKKKLKLIAFIAALAFFVVPSVSTAVYVPEYLENSAALLENWETVAWTGSEAVVEGEAWHYWYEEDGARFDWYYSQKEGYSAEWALFTDGADAEYFSYVGALDESYADILEGYYYGISGDSLDYSLFDDGSYYFEDFYVYGEWEGRDVWYSWTMEEYASGSYYFDVDYETWDNLIDYAYTKSYDLDSAMAYEYANYFDVAQEQDWGFDYWESLETGAFDKEEWAYTMSSVYDAGWSYKYLDYTETRSWFSPDYSETWSSYSYVDYDETTAYLWDQEWYYDEWSNNITDSGYYENGYAYENWQNDGYESEYYTEGFDNWTIYNNGEGQETTWSSYYITKDVGAADWYYQTNTYSYTASDEYYYYQYGYDYNTGSSVWQNTEYEAQDTDWWDDFYEYKYDSEGTLLSYVGYSYEGTEATGYEAIEDWSEILQAEGDNAYIEKYTWSTYDPTRGDTREGYTYAWYDDPGNYYWEKEDSGTGAPNGDWYSESKRYERDVDGNGYNNQTYSDYDAAYQETYYSESMETYVDGYTTYDYYGYSYALADSDNEYSYWELYTRDETNGAQLTYESSYYDRDSDDAEVYMSYYKYDYTGVNNTYYYENSWESLASGATEESWSFQISGVSYESYYLYQGLDSYDEEKYFDEYGVGETWSSYSLLIGSGSESWEAYESDYVTYDYSETMLSSINGKAWTGEKVMYDYSEDMYSLYLYYSWPDGYFLEQTDELNLPL